MFLAVIMIVAYFSLDDLDFAPPQQENWVGPQDYERELEVYEFTKLICRNPAIGLTSGQLDELQQICLENEENKPEESQELLSKPKNPLTGYDLYNPGGGNEEEIGGDDFPGGIETPENPWQGGGIEIKRLVIKCHSDRVGFGPNASPPQITLPPTIVAILGYDCGDTVSAEELVSRLKALINKGTIPEDSKICEALHEIIHVEQYLNGDLKQKTKTENEFNAYYAQWDCYNVYLQAHGKPWYQNGYDETRKVKDKRKFTLEIARLLSCMSTLDEVDGIEDDLGGIQHCQTCMEKDTVKIPDESKKVVCLSYCQKVDSEGFIAGDCSWAPS